MKKVIILILSIMLISPALAKNENKNKKQKALPPGLEKKVEKTGQLPPGWQKKLQKGEVLDPTLYEIGMRNIVKPENYSLKPRLGTEVMKIENRIIRIKKDTKEILDILNI